MATIINLFVVILSWQCQLYHGGDMMYEMRKLKPEPTLLPTQGNFNLPHHIGMAFDDPVGYTQHGNGVPRVTYPMLLPTELTPQPHLY